MLLRSFTWIMTGLLWVTVSTPSMADSRDHRQGERLFRDQCSGCHSLDPGVHRAGPSLDGLIGRPAGDLDDFDYSQAMQDAEHTWTTETLDAFLADPDTFVPGTAMVFWGLDETQRDQVIHYLESATAE
ncbi:c-type cytochrome [Aidingimonas halophila]|uniref:Cytochrome c n=1 Tax=Aidingimonas halophila TaxID=574349 RepID=A0A1H2ZA38_9GAMM|nr:c-type cytochrome [Aidingimonas halophila]GHC15578.1 cytochrome c [Aidingimonas halophila]SDX13858.1 cytochrome c [Aidingimonas halophila]